MAEIIIGKLCFGKDSMVYGLELCLSRAGIKAYSVTPATAKAVDVLLISVFWYHDFYALEDFYRKASIRPGSGKPIVVMGGMQATMTPELAAEYADYVYIGDADNDLADILKALSNNRRPACRHIYAKGDAAVPPPCEAEPTGYTVMTRDKNPVARIEIARGCKHKCPFCCLSGLKPYREVPYEQIKDQIIKSRGRRVSLFAPERTLHSRWEDIDAAATKYGCHDMGQDARLENIMKIKSSSVTFGLEGISERLRKSIKKPFSDKYVVEKIGSFVESRKNIARVSVYFIADLPGESNADWKEVYALFEDIERAEWSRRLVLCPILNPLSPKRFTQFENAPINIFKDYGPIWSNLLRKNGSQWGYRVIETLVWGPYERTKDAIVQRAGRRAADIIKAMPTGLLVKKPPLLKRNAAAKDILKIAESRAVSLEQLERGAISTRTLHD